MEDKKSKLEKGIIETINSIKNNEKKYNKLISEIFHCREYTLIKIFDKIKSYIIFENIPSTKEIINNFTKNLEILRNKLPDYKIDSDEYKSLSCIYGAFLGDAMGAYCEFLSPNENNKDRIFHAKPSIAIEGPGQVTDDSEMAMSMAYAIMEMPDLSNLSQEYLYFFYGVWFKSHPLDIGNATFTSLHYFDFNNFFLKENGNNLKAILKNIQKENANSKANGFLMRISPFIIWYYFKEKNFITNNFSNPENIQELYFSIRTEVIKDNACTHPNDEIPSASSLFIMMVLGVLCGKNSLELFEIITKMYDKNKDLFSKNKSDLAVLNFYKNTITLFSDKNFEKNNYFIKVSPVYKKIGWYEHAFKLSIYYLMNIDKYLIKEKEDVEKKYNAYREIIFEICNFGGDTDTNAAIVGTLIGPIIGYKNFRSEFSQMINRIPKNRPLYSPIFMVYYIEYLRDAFKENKNEGFNFIRMFLEMAFKDIK